MPDPKKAKVLQADIAKLNADVTSMKKLCTDLAGNANEICPPDLRKKAASGQHGLKDNATRGQVLKGMQERINMVKADIAKKTKELAAVS